VIARFQEYRSLPIIISESDPDNCAACKGPQLGYRNTTMYSSYTAASLARIQQLADKYGLNLEGVLTWAFEFENQPYFDGFRVLSSRGLPLPVFNTFRALSRMTGNRVVVDNAARIPLETLVKDGVRKNADVDAIATVDGQRVNMLV